MRGRWIVGILFSAAVLLLMADIVAFLHEDFRFYEEFEAPYYSTPAITKEQDLLLLATERYVYGLDLDLNLSWRYTARGWIFWIQSLANGRVMILVKEKETYFVQIIDEKGILVREFGMEFIDFLSYEILDSVVINDVEADESEEIIIGTREGKVYLLDDKGEILWEINAGSPVTRIRVANIDGDSTLEVMMSILV